MPNPNWPPSPQDIDKLKLQVKKLEEQNATITQAIWKLIDKVEILEKKDKHIQDHKLIKQMFKEARFNKDATDD